jgi:hypothetical protein
MNDDRAGSLGGAVKNDLAPKLQRQLFIGGIGNVARLVADRHVLALRKSMRYRDGKGRQQDDLETEEAKQQHLESRSGIEWCRLHKIQSIWSRQGRRVMSYRNVAGFQMLMPARA